MVRITMTDHRPKQEDTTLNYTVVDYEYNKLREGSITASFPLGMEWIQEIDILHSIAYDLEDCGGEGKEYTIQNE